MRSTSSSTLDTTAVSTPVTGMANRDDGAEKCQDEPNTSAYRDILPPMPTCTLYRSRSRSRFSPSGLSSDTTRQEMLLRAQTLGASHTDTNAAIERTVTMTTDRGEEEVRVINWLPNDPDHPFNWPLWRKWSITLCVCYLTSLTAMNATSIGVLAEFGVPWFHTSQLGFTIGLFVYLFAIAWTPLVLAPMSELFGRSPIYHSTSVINALLYLPQILSHNYSGFLAARWFQGMASSVGNSMVGGTIADLFSASDRGPAMNTFALAIFSGQAFGSVIFGWVGSTLGIQWGYGLQAIFAGISVLLNIVVLRETRADVLLARKARRLTRITGVKHITPEELQKKSFLQLIRVSAIRPLQYLFVEPIVSAMSLWIGFAWGCIFLGTSSVLLVFRQYGWSSGLTGTSETCMFIGAVFGFVSNIHNEGLYRRAAAKNPSGRAAPEVRLYWAATGGLLFPLGLFGFAWSGRPEVHWIVPAICLSLSNWGVYVMYSSVFNYLADTYEIYSSSAQASHSFVRNLFSSIFPLFSHQMYVNLGYPIASTLVASIATVLAIAPVLIIIYGPQLRAKSKVASAIWGAEDEKALSAKARREAESETSESQGV